MYPEPPLPPVFDTVPPTSNPPDPPQPVPFTAFTPFELVIDALSLFPFGPLNKYVEPPYYPYIPNVDELMMIG